MFLFVSPPLLQYPPQPYKFGYDVKDGEWCKRNWDDKRDIYENSSFTWNEITDNLFSLGYGGTLNQKEEGDSHGNKKGNLYTLACF